MLKQTLELVLVRCNGGFLAQEHWIDESGGDVLVALGFNPSLWSSVCKYTTISLCQLCSVQWSCLHFLTLEGGRAEGGQY